MPFFVEHGRLYLSNRGHVLHISPPQKKSGLFLSLRQPREKISFWNPASQYTSYSIILDILDVNYYTLLSAYTLGIEVKDIWAAPGHKMLICRKTFYNL